MAVISNRIMVSAIDDGTTIHGALRSSLPLAQGYDKNTNTFIPDWNKSTNQPWIYLTLLNGSDVTVPSNYKWYWNGAELTFDANGYSTLKDSDDESVFLKTTVEWNNVNVPALRILRNLAVVGSLNDDVIEIRGDIELGGAYVSFSSGLSVQLGELNANGYLGVISFYNGKSTITSDDDQVGAQGFLYTAGEVLTFRCKWMVNGTTYTEEGTYGSIRISSSDAQHPCNIIFVSGDDESGVLDIATLVCTFLDINDSTKVLATATATIDDIGDEEYLYIFFNKDDNASASNGSPVSLHKNESVAWDMFVAKADDATAIDTRFTNYYFRPTNKSGELYSGIADLSGKTPDSDGFYDITTTVDGNAHGGVVITYSDCTNAGKNISGIVKAVANV